MQSTDFCLQDKLEIVIALVVFEYKIVFANDDKKLLFVAGDG